MDIEYCSLDPAPQVKLKPAISDESTIQNILTVWKCYIHKHVGVKTDSIIFINVSAERKAQEYKGDLIFLNPRLENLSFKSL
jgi:hypothetical protein